MQDKHIGKNPNLYSKEQLQEINDSYDSLTQKIRYTLVQLDKNWAMHSYHIMKNLHYIENPPETAEWNQTDLIIFNIFIETYLLQTRSLLDCYMRHVTLVLGKKECGFDAGKQVQEAIEIRRLWFHDKSRSDVRLF